MDIMYIQCALPPLCGSTGQQLALAMEPHGCESPGTCPCSTECFHPEDSWARDRHSLLPRRSAVQIQYHNVCGT
eukprot:6487351-Amphidinium_carterae.1